MKSGGEGCPHLVRFQASPPTPWMIFGRVRFTGVCGACVDASMLKWVEEFTRMIKGK